MTAIICSFSCSAVLFLFFYYLFPFIYIDKVFFLRVLPVCQSWTDELVKGGCIACWALPDERRVCVLDVHQNIPIGLISWGLCSGCHQTLQLQLIPHLISLNYLQKPHLLIGLEEIRSKLKTSLLLKDWLVMLNHLNLAWNKVLQQLMHWTCCICLYQWRQLNLWAPSINKTDIDYGIWIIEHFLS